MFLSKLLNRFKDKKEFPSKVNTSISIGKSFGKKAIFIQNIPQSGGEFIYMWKKIIKSLKTKNFNPKTCLLLGVAGGTIINELQKVYPNVQITAIELDPVILKVALENGFLKINKKITVKIYDAIKWIKKDTKKYDLIVVDLYIGDLNPQKSRKRPFLSDVKNHLKNNGLVLYNCHYQKDKEIQYKLLRKNINIFFSRTEELFIFPKNKILLLEK